MTENQSYIMHSGAIAEPIDWIDPALCFAPFATTPHALWLDSADTAHPAARFSFIAVSPFDSLTIRQVDNADTENHQDSFTALKAKIAPWQEDWAELPDIFGNQTKTPVFRGGAAGLFSYDLARNIEKLPPEAAPFAVRDTDMPDLSVGLYDLVIGFDHHRSRCVIFSTGFPATGTAARANRARNRIEDLKSRLRGLPITSIAAPPACPPLKQAPQSDLSRHDFEQKVQKVVDYIHAGEIFQANISHRFTAALSDQDTAYGFYLRLREHAAAPFSAFARFDDWALASASPEGFLSCRDGWAETRPIKGTRPRGLTPEADKALIAQLLTSEKDHAENVMIVDLLRNDLAKVCRHGSLEVPKLCALESFETVHHLVSTIRGKLQDGKSASDLLQACFPGGSITGAPKIRAMEIIAELEGNIRGPYCGALGYIGFDGTMDTSIIIRSAVIHDRQVSFQVGGGIVADSQPAAEYEETLDKARGLLAALGTDMPVSGRADMSVSGRADMSVSGTAAPRTSKVVA